MSRYQVNPLVVFLFNLLLPLAIMLPGNRLAHPFYMTFAAVVLLSGGKWKRLMKWAVFYGLVLLLERWLHSLGGSVSSFFGMWVLITRQFTPCMMMASVLLIDYTPTDLIAALQPLHLPKTFLVALAVVVRYIPTFKQEFGIIRESMRLRCIPYSVRTPIRSFQYFLVPQLFRCAMLADEITAAGLTKGITNPSVRTAYQDLRMKWADWAMAAVLVMGTGVLVLWKY